MAPRSDLWYVGAAYPLTAAVLLDGQLSRLAYDGSVNKSSLAVVRATYAFSKRTATYAQVARIANRGTAAVSVSGGAAGSNPGPGMSQTGVMVGIRHTF